MTFRNLIVACFFLFTKGALAASILPIEDADKYIIERCGDINFLLGIEGVKKPTRVAIKVMDVLGKEIDASSFTPTVVAEGKAFIHANLRIDSCRQSGWFHIAAEAEDAQGRKQPLASVISFVILPRVSSDGFWGVADLWGLAAMTSRFNADDALLLKKLGVSGIRFFVDWRSMRHPDDWSVVWKQMDSILEAARSVDLDVLPVLVVAPEYAVKNARGEEGGKVPDDLSWRKFVRMLGEKYRGQITQWEIWNEANVKGFWNGGVEEYASKLESAHEILKKIDASNTIVSAGTSGVDIRWTKELIARTNSFDILAVHTYRSVPPETGAVLGRHYGGNSLEDDLLSLRAILPRGKRIWITETGLNTREGRKGLFEPVSELEQAARLVRHAVIAKSNGVDRGYWWLLRDGMGLGTGLFRREWTQVFPKPSLAAMAWTNGMLTKETKVTKVLSEKDLFQYRLYRKDVTWNVIWSLNNRKISVSCGRGFHLFDMMGVVRDFQFFEGKCELSLEAGLPYFWSEK